MKMLNKKALTAGFKNAGSKIALRGYILLAILIISLLFIANFFNVFAIKIVLISVLILFSIWYFNSLIDKYKFYKSKEENLNDGTHILYETGYDYLKNSNISKKIIVSIKNGKRNGTYTEYFNNSKQIQFQKQYFNGYLNGIMQEFYENGEIKLQSTWKNGIQEGETNYFNYDGTLIRSSIIVDGDYYKEIREYYKHEKVRFICNDNNFTFFKWNIDFTEKNKICEFSYNPKNNVFFGIWKNYNEFGRIDFDLDFNDAQIIEFKYNSNHNWWKGYKVKKNNYNSDGEINSTSFIYIKSFFQIDQIDPKFTFNRFNEQKYSVPTGIKGPPGISIRYIEIKPLVNVFDLIEFLDNTYVINNDLIISDNIRLTSNNNLNAFEFYERAKNKFYELKDYSGAMDDFNKSIQKNPNFSKAFFNRGILKKVMEDNNGALEDYNKAIELDENSEAYRYRAGIKNTLKDFVGAMNDYNFAIEKHPNQQWMTYYKRGCLKIELEDYKGAILDFDMSIDTNINSNKRWPRSDFYKKRGDCKFKIEDYKGAIEDLNKAINLDPNCIEEVNIEIENIKKKLN
jgi:tetratricopeptide (TPR) repeat protein